MCQQHRSGEHLEAHIFVSKMEAHHSLKGFSDGSMFFGADFIKYRHDALAETMSGHQTPLEITEQMRKEYPFTDPTWNDYLTSLGTLYQRCENCRKVRLAATNTALSYV
jgi:hypothetical protein